MISGVLLDIIFNRKTQSKDKNGPCFNSTRKRYDSVFSTSDISYLAKFKDFCIVAPIIIENSHLLNISIRLV